MRDIFKLKKMVFEVSKEAYDGRNNEIEVTATEDGKILLGMSNSLYDMLTEGEHAWLEEIFKEISGKL